MGFTSSGWRTSLPARHPIIHFGFSLGRLTFAVCLWAFVTSINAQPVSGIDAQVISVLIKRAQDALTAGGFATSAILAEPQDLKGGEFTLTVLHGRLRAVRFASGGEVRTTPRPAVLAARGNNLKLWDVEQALENFKRVPTAEANIKEMGDTA